MKSLSFNATNAVNNPLGEDPFFVIKVEWRTTGTRWYADRDLATGASGVSLDQAQGRIIQIGNLAAQKKQDVVGSMGAISFVLDDSDGKLKQDFDANLVEGTRCTIYHAFESAKVLGDLVLLMTGVIISPAWSEGERTVGFEVETKIHDLEVGFAVEQEFYDNMVVSTPLLAESAIGQAWPLCFGSVVHLPALKLFAPPETALNGNLKKGDTQVLVEDASKFPSGEVDVIIDGIVFSVTVDKVNNRLNILDENVPKYQGIPFADRVIGDPDENNPWAAWVAQDVSVVNTFIYYVSEFGNTVYHRVIRQEGRKIFLDPQLVKKKGSTFSSGFGFIPSFLGPPTIIQEVAKYGRDGWGIQMSYAGGKTLGDGAILFPTPSPGVGSVNMRNTIEIIAGVTWKFPSGTAVRLWGYPPGSADHHVTYVANLIQSSLVKVVYAWRTNPKTGQRLFKQVPTSYYAVNLNDSINIVDQFNNPSTITGVTTIRLKWPLDEAFGQGWEDTIYVSLKSSVGPNASDIIKWLLQTYSNLPVDAASFAAVKAQLAKYPMGFALFQKENVLQLVETLAWQSRCALIEEDGTAKLKYLSKEPTEDLTIAESVIEQRSGHVAATQFEDVTTSFRAKWRKDYSGKPGRQRTFALVENIATFGLVKREFDFFAYNVQSLVAKSAKFWAHRMANVWKVAKLNMLKRIAIALEMFDTVKLNLSDTSIFGTFKGVLDAHSVEADGLTYGLSLWLPVVSGTSVQDPNAWLSDGGDSLPADPVDSIVETVVDEQWADPLSASYSQTYVASRPAKIIDLLVNVDPVNAAAFPGSFAVDVYDNGYVDSDGNDLPKTNDSPLIAFPTDVSLALDRTLPSGISPSMNLNPGDRVSIFNVTGTRWMFNVPADKAHAPATVTVTPASPGTLDIYAKGFDKPATKTGVTFTALDADDPPKAGDKVFTFKRDDVIYAGKSGAGGLPIWGRVTTTGSATYSFVEIDPTTGADKPGGVSSTAKEVTGSTIILPGERVGPIFKVGASYVFWYPLAACT